MLKLELVVLVLAPIRRFQDIVDVVDLRVVHLVVRLGLLDALADLESGPAISAETANLVPGVGRLRLHFINLVLILSFDRAAGIAALAILLLAVDLHYLLLELLESLVCDHLAALIAEGNCVAATELVQDFCCWLRSLLA